MIAASSVAEFGSVLLLSLLFSASGGTVGERIARPLVFAAVVAAVAVAIFAASRSVRLGGVFLRLQDTTAELRVRAAVALLIGFVVLAQRVGLETIFGAFMAGVIVAALQGRKTEQKLLPVNAAALICAGVLSTLIFPAGALAILRRQDS